ASLGCRSAGRALPPMTLKGMPAPVKVFEVSGRVTPEVGSTGEWSRATAMVGRAREQALLLARLEALADGAGGVAVIIGDPGIGKSHLLRHTLTQARAHGVTTLAGAARALERCALSLARRPVYARLLAHTETPTESSAREEFLAARLAVDERNLLPLLSALLPFSVADNDTTATMRGQVRAETTRGLLAGGLTRVGGRERLCLAIEDAHWMDSASWALLHRVMAAGTI